MTWDVENSIEYGFRLIVSYWGLVFIQERWLDNEVFEKSKTGGYIQRQFWIQQDELR